ncbi:fluoride efflux transporter FluC [Rossellomorea sp. NPDC071047]|uniref:fluoride efflux transporter FluC n=1 Tax=Rossellomorea sp. NPDC071047 TaxID=3390675 RepID=UPI003CFD3DCB
MIKYLLVGIGGALGSFCRWGISYLWTIQNGLPFATLTANLLGSFLLAYFYSRCSYKYEKAYLLIATGFLGSFTTFSTLSIELVTFLLLKQWGMLFLYMTITAFGGMLFAWLGFFSGRKGRVIGHGN